MKRTLLFGGLLAVSGPVALADTTLVDDDFESYANDSALYAVWEPRAGNGGGPPAFPDDGILTTDDTLFPGLEGQGVDHIGGSVMQWTGLTPDAPINPSAGQSIRMVADIYDDASGNKRMTAGLRSRDATENLIELGHYNTNGVDPVDGVTAIPNSGYQYRLILFFTGDGIVQNPNWVPFVLDTALDRPDDADEITTNADIGAGWHRYFATVTPDTVTVELDLFRDGLDNGATATAGSDVAGLDASVTYNLTTTPAGFDSFRIGAPSGLTSAGGGVAFDNVLLELIDVVGGGIEGDYDDGGQVEQTDLDFVLSNWGDTDISDVTGWVNFPGGGAFDGLVDQNELDGVLLNWGSTSAPDFSGSAVPEPGTLAALAGLGVLALRRRSA